MEVNSFEDLNLEDSLLKALKAIDYTVPSPIQARAIPVALTGVDIIGQAQTGTGKTAAFGIPMIQNISKSGRYTKGLVLCPTRELCIQVTNELKKLAYFSRHVSVFAIYGGDPINPQIKALKAGVDIVVGTPGRVMDHLSRGTLLLDGLEILTLDEADEMLNMGFREDLETILQSVPEHRQTILFSATMPKAILDITHLYQKNPQLIKVTPTNLTSASVEQFYIETDMNHRLKVLTYLLNAGDYAQAIVFCNTKAKVDELSNELAENLVKNDVLHGDLGQEKRNRILNKFRKGEFKVLVATDVAARGIDVPNVDLVCNYDVPFDPEYYVHRIGRTGRAGKEGKAYSFLAGSRDKRLLRQIESFAKVKVEQYKFPTATEIAR
ncbi:MAG TPA: DEAD/DEAH box helicase, partial [Saprospiraceae bacterium]|nr:DEAD/DEAH box helicase [Saprospiraceae bacterium]